MAVGGFQDNVIRVDLTAGAISTEALPAEDVMRKWVGGTGLGVYYLLNEAPMGVKPTDPRAPLLFMTGPLAGTAAPSSANWVTICFHYSIPYAAAIGHGHGFWAARLKHAGFEGILIYGRAETPVYLWIDDGKIELRDATKFWGLGTRDTERLIQEELGDRDRISVACIGPGGESILPGAMIKTDRNHGAGKGSPGAIMGSKNLKAIAVRGTGAVPLADPVAFETVSGEWTKQLLGRPPGSVAGDNYDGGITRVYSPNIGDVYGVAAKNLTDPEAGKKFAQDWSAAAERWQLTPKPSYNCPIGCSYDLKITDGEFAGFRGSFCGGAENLEGASIMAGVTDPAQAAVLTELYDDMGLESGTFGTIISVAFEGYIRGWLTKEDTDGLELTWGNWEAAMALVEKTIKREGIGAKLAKGLKESARLLGDSHGHADEFRKITTHVKGAGINVHDWRTRDSILFGYLVAGSGPAHFGMGGDHRPLLEAGVTGHQRSTVGFSMNIEEAVGRVDAVRKSQLFKIWWDSLGICWFAVSGVPLALRTTVTAMQAATGWKDLTTDEALQVGERIINGLRLIYQKRGFTKDDEFDYGERYLESPPNGPAHGRSLEPYVSAMVDEYYRLMGWDVETGYVTNDGVKRLGLEEFAMGRLPIQG